MRWPKSVIYYAIPDTKVLRGRKRNRKRDHAAPAQVSGLMLGIPRQELLFCRKIIHAKEFYYVTRLKLPGSEKSFRRRKGKSICLTRRQCHKHQHSQCFPG